MALYAASSSALAAGAAASIDSGAALGCLSLVFGCGGGCCCAGWPWPPYCAPRASRAAAIPLPHNNAAVSSPALNQMFNVPLIYFLLVKFPAEVRGPEADRFTAEAPSQILALCG